MTEPVRPEPDAKDWTWTLRERCPDCGLAAGDTRAADVPAIVEAVVARFSDRLGADDARLRPNPTTWSPTEYACHIRDVCMVFDGRLLSMLAEDDPQFANWNQDGTAIERRYWEQDPARVRVELADAADQINETIRSVRPGQLDRPGRRSDGSVFTVETLVQYFAHDLVHHAHDIGA